jgi:hypothetical protein
MTPEVNAFAADFVPAQFIARYGQWKMRFHFLIL